MAKSPDISVMTQPGHRAGPDCCLQLVTDKLSMCRGGEVARQRQNGSDDIENVYSQQTKTLTLQTCLLLRFLFITIGLSLS